MRFCTPDSRADFTFVDWRRGMLAYSPFAWGALRPEMPLITTEAGAQPPQKYRKRERTFSSPPPSDEDFLSISADGATDDEGYTKVISRRA